MNRNWSSVGIVVLIFVVLFLFIFPAYLSPNDLRGCGKNPDQKSIDANCNAADAIIAVSGGDTAARTDEAIRLFQNGWAPRLIFSGAAQDDASPSNALVMKQRAERAGINPTNIIIEDTSLNTKQNAENTEQLIRENGLKRIIIVTSAYHQRRAGLEFEKRFGSSVIVVNHPVASDNQWSSTWYLTFSGWWLLMGELIKIIGFYVGI